MKLPKDNVMLLSLINTALRDNYSDFEDLIKGEDIDGEAVISRLSCIGYSYNKSINQFI